MASLSTNPIAKPFARWARGVRWRLLARRVLTGTTLGLLAGVLVAATAWWLRLGPWRPLGAGLGVVGGALGGWWAQRRRWDDTTVALYLDQRLNSHEAIVTAVELAPRRDDVRAYPAILENATSALQRPPAAAVWPRVWRRWHAAAPIALAAIGGLTLVALPSRPAAAPPAAGRERVSLSDTPGLDKVIQLSELSAHDPETKQRLERLSQRAAALRKQLREGMPKRRAQADVAKLRERVAAQRQRFGSGEQRRGLEAALKKMAQHSTLSEAQHALGDRDLNAFDKAMAKLANLREAKDRAAARGVLAQAAKAARAHGADDVADAIEEQQKLLQQRGRRADLLKQLAEALGDSLSTEAAQALQRANQSGDPEAMQALADRLADALAQLDDAARKRLAKRLRERAKQASSQTGANNHTPPSTAAQLAAMQQQLTTAAGQKALAEQLRQLANAPASAGAQQQLALTNAERGLADVAQQLGRQGQAGAAKPGAGAAKPGAGAAKPGAGAAKPGAGAAKPGAGRGGVSRGGGRGDHHGHTDRVSAKHIRAKANTPLLPGAPNAGQSQGRAPGRSGETADRSPAGELGRVGPGEVGALERSDVPEPYRRQVGRYFQP